ncbi:MAG: TRAP-type mannitol/chloroaromatic compound transport system permease small subunit [Ascidiaceihabitans sp.]|jgi:TRAP-type mannitol/chloroaromatic compound transport system permease small subunit
MTDTPQSQEATPLTVDAVLAITDPGEVNRDQHGVLDRLMINVGNVVAWAFPLLMIAIVAQVFLRGNGHNQAWLDDAQWWIYGFAMLTAFGYAITTSSHVRVDILHEHYSPEKKARIEVFALGWLLLPFIGIMFDVLFHYAYSSVIAGEGSDSPNGLHHLYLLKASLPILFLLAGLAAYATLIRNLRVYSPARLHQVILAMLPMAIFMAWRLVVYVLYWFVFLTNSDIKARRILREPIFDYALLMAIALVAVVFVIGYLRNRASAKG